MPHTSPQAVASLAGSAAKRTDKEPCSDTTAAKKQKTHLEHLLTNAIRYHNSHAHDIEVNKHNMTSWIAAVSEWFETRKEQFDFLNINDLKPKTVQMMAWFEAELVVQVMDKCAGVQVTGKGSGLSRGNSVVQDMQKFNAIVFDELQHKA